MKHLVLKIKGLLAFFTLIKDLYQTEKVFRIIDSIEDDKYWTPVIQYLQSVPSAATALEKKTLISSFNLDEMGQLPLGTLGRSYHDYLKSQNLDPYFYPNIATTNTQQYIRLHLYQSHDLWHIATGFGTDPAGELGLQAFYIAQVPSAVPGIILAAGILNCVFFHPEDLNRRMSAIMLGWNMGKKSKLLFGVEWSGLWSQSLDKIRKDFSIPENDFSSGNAIIHTTIPYQLGTQGA